LFVLSLSAIASKMKTVNVRAALTAVPQLEGGLSTWQASKT